MLEVALRGRANRGGLPEISNTTAFPTFAQGYLSANHSPRISRYHPKYPSNPLSRSLSSATSSSVGSWSRKSYHETSVALPFPTNPLPFALPDLSPLRRTAPPTL